MFVLFLFGLIGGDQNTLYNSFKFVFSDRIQIFIFWDFFWPPFIKSTFDVQNFTGR